MDDTIIIWTMDYNNIYCLDPIHQRYGLLLVEVQVTYHYYTKSYAQRFEMGLGDGWPGCPPRLFETGQPGQQSLTEAGAVKKPPRLILN